MNVWIDITAPAHVLVFRPLIAILRGRGDTVEITARDYAQTVQLLELHGIEADVLGRHGGRSRLGKFRSLTSRLHDLRSWARGREFDVALAHGSHELTHDRAAARDPERDHLRLRVRVAAASARLPRCDAGRRAGGDPARAAGALRRAAAEARPVPGPEGGVLPRRLRARPRRARAVRARPGEDARRRAHAAGRLALPPALEPALPAGARAPGPERGRERDRDPAHRGAARRTSAGSGSLRSRCRSERWTRRA